MSGVVCIVSAFRAAPQIARLVRTLCRTPEISILIHLDRRSGPDIEARLRAELADQPGVHFLPRRPVRWGRWSAVDVMLRGLEAIERLGLDPDHTVLVSGQDYPIKPPEEIVRRLTARPDVAFLHHLRLPTTERWQTQRGGLDRVEKVHMWIPRRGPRRLPIRRLGKLPLAPFGGSFHGSLGRDHRRYVLELRRRDPGLVKQFKWMGNPTELFFQTVLLNSPLRDRVVNDDLMYADWRGQPNHPRILTEADLPELERSSALLARKFDPDVDARILDAIDERLLAMAPR